MINTIDATLDQRPEALHGIDVVKPFGVNPLAMLDNGYRSLLVDKGNLRK